LVKEGILTRQQLNVALERQVTFGGRIGTNLIELRILTEEEFTNFLSKFYKVPAATPEKLSSISEDALHALSQELMEKYRVLPLKKEGRRLQVAVLDPNDEKIDELGFITNFTIIPRVISELRLLYELERYYGIKSDRRFIRFLDRFNPTTEVTDSVEKMKSALRDARNSEEIAELLLRAAHTVATRVAIFNSGGVASFPMDGQSIDKVIQLADMALYRSKAEGRNRVIMHQSFFFSDSDAGKE